MSDPSFTEFYDRIDRITRARSRGEGFEASGTLGRSFYASHRRRGGFRIPLLRQGIALLVSVTVIKAVFLHMIGTEDYQQRVARLTAGEGIDRLGGFLMQADPVTTALAGQLSHLIRMTS